MSPEAARLRMVERQLRAKGITDERVLAAMARVPREEFVPAELRERAYEDSALPIGAEQTISQPWIVAMICQALELRGPERVLEVGTGSGYSTAVLSMLARHVVSIERHETLSRSAAATLASQGIHNVELIVGDGSVGLFEPACFDAIAVHATAPREPAGLQAQLGEGGRLVVPLDAGEADVLTLYRRRDGRLESEPITPCRFVPLIGEEGYSE